MSDRLSRWAAIAGAVFLAGFGVWALLGPRSFYDAVASWPPYNRHFLHDIGTFQIAMGAALLLALAYRDALFVALASVGGGQALHAVVHAVDRELGGEPTDPLIFAILAAVLLAGAWRRWRTSSAR